MTVAEKRSNFHLPFAKIPPEVIRDRKRQILVSRLELYWCRVLKGELIG